MIKLLRHAVVGLALSMAMVGAGVAAAPKLGSETSSPSQQVLLLMRTPPAHLQANGGVGGGYDDQLGRGARMRTVSKLARARGLNVVDEWPMPLLGVDCFILAVPEGKSVAEVTASLSREPGVVDVQANNTFFAQGAAPTHSDPLFRAQPASLTWRLADLHEIATGYGVRVAVIDSLVDASQPDLIGQIQTTQNFVANRPAKAEDHGTAVAGVIAARADNGIGIVGIAPRARIMALRACWQDKLDTICDSLSLAQALHYAIDHNAQIINLSLSGPADNLLGKLIDVAQSRGIKVVAAYDRKAAGGGFPASHAGVVAVVDEAVALAPAGVYSAPGHDVPTTQPGGKWGLVNGSSFAAAHVTGLLALVTERRPLEQRALGLVQTRVSRGGIDACASLLRVADGLDCACARKPEELAAAR